MFHKSKVVGLAVLATLLLSGLAVAQDRDQNRNNDREDNRDRWGYQDRDQGRDQDRDYDRDRDRNYDRDRDRDRDAYRNGDRFRGGNVARDWGFRDGTDAARGDERVRKSFNPNPRGRYKHSDRGYERYFGDKHEYQEQYARAYREGYEQAWQRGGWRR